MYLLIGFGSQISPKVLFVGTNSKFKCLGSKFAKMVSTKDPVYNFFDPSDYESIAVYTVNKETWDELMGTDDIGYLALLKCPETIVNVSQIIANMNDGEARDEEGEEEYQDEGEEGEEEEQEEGDEEEQEEEEQEEEEQEEEEQEEEEQEEEEE